MKTKNFLIYAMLFAPIVAHATGPSAVGQGQTAVIATASAPYATATEQTGDSTTVVSASYVKGAYNDAIAAVNKVNASKQAKLFNEADNEISSRVAVAEGFTDVVESAVMGSEFGGTTYDRILITAAAAADGIAQAFNYKRINAVTSWGNDTPTQLPLSNLDE